MLMTTSPNTGKAFLLKLGAFLSLQGPLGAQLNPLHYLSLTFSKQNFGWSMAKTLHII